MPSLSAGESCLTPGGGACQQFNREADNPQGVVVNGSGVMSRK